MKPSKLEIERDRLRKFATLLKARADLISAGLSLDQLRSIGARGDNMKAYVCWCLDHVWACQKECCEYELKYPLER